MPEIRNIVEEEQFVFERLYKQLERMDFSNFVCSPLVNGGCGIGKSTALTDDRMYELFARKLGKTNPNILFIESRSATRDQLRQRVSNPHYTFLQFSNATTLSLTDYDIVIIDEAHSLFIDSDFAARQMEPLARWLRENKCFQIFITASDAEFLGLANTYFNNREFSLTFPDIDNIHMKIVAEQMILSISSKKLTTVVKIKEKDFFQEGHRGIFFTLTARDAVSLRDYYVAQGYKCAFYISQQNTTQLSVEVETNDDEEDTTFLEYTSFTKTINLLDYYNSEENSRRMAGLPTIRESLLAGRMPDDIDYLFITDTGREGLDICEGSLDFIFIEDTIPLTINQKIYRYRGNLPLAYVSLPQRRLEKIYSNSIKQVQRLMGESQDYLRGYYQGSKSKKGKNPLEQVIVYNEETGLYEVSQLYLAKLSFYSNEFNEIRANIKDENYLHMKYGERVKKFEIEDLNETKRKRILEEFFEEKDGEIITEEKKQKWVEELKAKELTNDKQKRNFRFDTIIAYCKKYEICEFQRHKANKKDIEKNPELIYRKEYLQIKKNSHMK